MASATSWSMVLPSRLRSDSVIWMMMGMPMTMVPESCPVSSACDVISRVSRDKLTCNALGTYFVSANST